MKVRLLKRLRSQAEQNLEFIGGWSGYWITKIDGIYFHSNIVSGLNYVLNDSNFFIQNAISKYVSMKRNGKYSQKVFVTTKYRKL